MKVSQPWEIVEPKQLKLEKISRLCFARLRYTKVTLSKNCRWKIQWGRIIGNTWLIFENFLGVQISLVVLWTCHVRRTCIDIPIWYIYYAIQLIFGPIGKRLPRSVRSLTYSVKSGGTLKPLINLVNKISVAIRFFWLHW